MRILHIIASLSSGGAEKLLTDLVVKMKKNKVECEVLVLTKHNNFFGEILHENNIPVYYSESPKIYSVQNILFIKKIIASNHFDIVHTHLYSAQLFSVIANMLNYNKSILVTTEHSTNNNRRNKKILRFLDLCMYRKYKKIISITPEVQNNLKKYLKLPSNNFEMIFNGIDLDKYYYAKAWQKEDIIEGSEGEKWIIMVAGMRPAKDQETLIRASNYLPPNYRILFVGSGERKQQVEDYAKKYSSNKITFLGARNDIAELLKTSDLFVLSSHWEGFGLVLVEAAAAGLPVVASDIVGMGKVATAVGGYLFKPKDEQELAKVIEQALEEGPRINAEKLEKFSIENTVKGYLNVYDNLL
ncbi:glycosyltransferase [Caryophanon tenue]|uniref:Glycosyl transferase n=1 Tax=Caryophanon tenue TaxID=33978 RepID=A0A1C0YAM1_9BACL|nr:glycosyltransferase [Caryophanon tenue]OCS84236.1 hypothetical protein A6M13_15730 [Caryophanon tenue]